MRFVKTLMEKENLEVYSWVRYDLNAILKFYLKLKGLRLQGNFV